MAIKAHLNHLSKQSFQVSLLKLEFAHYSESSYSTIYKPPQLDA